MSDCNYIEYDGRKYAKSVFRQKLLNGEIVLKSQEERESDKLISQIQKAIKDSLPAKISKAITIVKDVPTDILGRSDLFLSLKDILNDNGINDELLINWAGINKDRIGNIKGYKSTEQLEKVVQDIYNKKTQINNHPALKDNKLALESFNQWVNALDKYPVAFKDLMLTHAIKNLNPQRRSKFVLQLSSVALTNAYGITVNKPHEANRIGKLYDQEVLRAVNEAGEHEPSASGKGYWVHVPRSPNGNQLGYNSYEEAANAIKKLEDNIKEVEEIKNKPPKFFSQEPDLTREDANKYGLEDYEYVRVESSYSRGFDPHPTFLNNKIGGGPYEGYYIHGYNTRHGKPGTKIVPITKTQAEDLWIKAAERYPSSAYEVQDRNKIQNLEYNITRLKELKEGFDQLKPEDWTKNSAQYKVNVELLRKLSPSTWCTSSGMAGHYVENYDNYVLVVNGITVAGIEAGDKGANGKVQVKEVTSRANNGVASIDHLDDINAFFEKHNLDTNNNSLKKAQKAKAEGKTDKQIDPEAQNAVDDGYWVDEYDERGLDDQWGNEYEDRGDVDDPGAEYAREQEEHNTINEVRAIETLDEALRDLNTGSTKVLRYFYELPQDVRNGSEVLATRAVEYNGHNITHISSTVPFYNELVIKSFNTTPQVYRDYLSQEVRDRPEIKAAWDAYNLAHPYWDELPFSKTNTNQVQGYYDPKSDKVVVVASNTPINEAAKVGIHEVAHRGMIRMAKELGGTKELNQILFNAEEQLMEKVPELLKRTGHKNIEALVRDYGFNINSEEGKAKLLSELAARWAETLVDKPKPSWWKRFLQAIRDWIKKFLNKILSEEEVNELVGGFVRYGSENDSKVHPVDELKAMDLGRLDGKLEADHRKDINSAIVNRPFQKIGGGESFANIEKRVLTKFTELLRNAPNNAVIVTNSSVLKIMSQFDQDGRPSNLHINRAEYIKEHTHTGEIERFDSDHGRLIVVRHGQVEHPELLRTTDAQLSEKGKEQARNAGKELSDVDIPVIYSSPLPRTMETAKLIEEQQKPSLSSPTQNTQFNSFQPNQGLTQITNSNTFTSASGNPSSGQSTVPHTFDGVIGKIIADRERIKLNDSIITDPKSPLVGQRMHTWVDTVAKKDFKQSITESIHGTLAKEAKQKHEDAEKWLALAENGTVAHKYFEDFINKFIDKDGNFTVDQIVNFDTTVYKGACQFIADFLQDCKNQDAQARVFPEAVIGKKDYSLAGAIDLIVVFPDMSYRKLDWKLIEKLGKNGVDPRRREEFEKQANIQAAILKSDYGLSDRRMDYMVPMKVYGFYKNEPTAENKDKKKYVITALECAPYNVSKLKEDDRYLEPVVIHYADSDEDALMKVYKKLHDASKLIMQMVEKGSPEERRAALDRYNALIKAANNLVFRQDVSSLTQEIEAECNLIKHLLQTNKLEKLADNMDLLTAYSDASTFFLDRLEMLESKIQNATQEEKAILNSRKIAFEAASGKATKLRKAIQTHAIQYSKQLAEQVGLGDITTPEREIGFTSAYMLRQSLIQMKTLQLSRMFVNQATEDWNKDRTEIAQKFIKAIEKVQKEVKGELIDIYKKHLLIRSKNGSYRLTPTYKSGDDGFWKVKQKKSQARDLEWFKENTVFNRERYDKDLAALTKDWDNSVDIGHRTKEQRDKAIVDFKNTFDVGVDFSNAGAIAQETTNFGNKYLIGNEKWYSDEYKHIQDTPALKNLYDNIIEFNQALHDLGYLDEAKIYSFFPAIENSVVDSWKQGEHESISDLLRRFLEPLTVNDAAISSSGKINPVTGAQVKEIRIAHLNQLEHPEKQSADIGKIYAIMAEQLAKAKALKTLEPVFEKLLINETVKLVKEVNPFGKPTGSNVTNVKNAAVAKQMIEYMLYGKQEAVAGIMPQFLRKALDSIGLEGHSISGMKLLEGFVFWNALLRMGFSLGTAFSNIIGGNSFLSFLAKANQVFSTEHFLLAEKLVTTKNKKMMSLLKALDTHTRSHTQAYLEKEAAAIKPLMKAEDAAYYIMERGDEHVQNVAAAALLMSSYIDETGRIVNIKQSMLKSAEAETMDPNELEKKAAELSKTQSLWATVQFDKAGHPFWIDKDGNKINVEEVKDGEIQSTLTNFKAVVDEVVAQALGNSDLNNPMGANFVPGIRSAFQFRSWMFGVGEGLLGHTKYDPTTDTYREGRFRTLGRALTTNFFTTIGTLLKSFGGNKFSPSAIKAAKDDYEKQKKEYEEKTGQPFTETEAEHLHRYIGAIQANMRHLMMLVAFAILIGITKPDKDTKPDAKARDIYLNRYLKKFFNEFSFWLDPREAAQMFQNTIPAMGLLLDILKFLGATEQEIQGLITGDEKMVKHAHPLKRGLELFPLSKQVIDISALFWSQDTRDNWGMYKNNSNYSFY